MGKVNNRGAQLLLGMPRSKEKSFFSVKKNDLDISFQLKRSDCMKRRQTVCMLFTAELKDGKKACWRT